MAAFLVDLWCVGLKDAWGLLDISADLFRERVLDASRPVDLIRVDLDVVKRLVAGSIRFSRENGFRLPKRHERWVALLGDVGDIDKADLTDFGVDGGLRYVGDAEDLKKRLVDGEPSAFLAREGVDYVMEAPDPEFLDDSELAVDDSESAVDEAFDTIKEHGLSAVRQWCFANGERPHPRLPEAWDIMFEAMMQVEPASDDAEMTDEECDVASGNIQRFLDIEPPNEAAGLAEALSQVREFVQQFDSPEALAESLGCDFDLPDDEV